MELRWSDWRGLVVSCERLGSLPMKLLKLVHDEGLEKRSMSECVLTWYAMEEDEWSVYKGS